MVCIAILLVFLEGNSILMYACLIVAKRADQDAEIMFKKKINEKTVDKLFIALMLLMIVINIYNIYKFM